MEKSGAIGAPVVICDKIGIDHNLYTDCPYWQRRGNESDGAHERAQTAKRQGELKTIFSFCALSCRTGEGIFSVICESGHPYCQISRYFSGVAGWPSR
jgi:hypothetical protein